MVMLRDSCPLQRNIAYKCTFLWKGLGVVLFVSGSDLLAGGLGESKYIHI